MTVKSSGQYFPSGQRFLLLLAVILGGTVAIGAIAVREPLLAVGAVVIAFMSAIVLIWPDGATLVVIFILYTNAAVVAVKSLGVPFIVGASLPALLVIPLGYYLVFRREELRVDKIFPLMVLFLVVHMVGTMFAVDIDSALETTITFASEGVGLYFLLLNTVRTPRMMRLAIWVLVIAGLLMGSLSFFQQITQTYETDYAGFAQVSNAAFGTGEERILGEVEQPRLAGPIGEVNRYAQTMLMLMPLALFRFWGERSRALRALAALALIFIGLGMALTFSRGAAIGLLMMLIIVAFMRYIKFSQLLVVLLVALLVFQLVPQFGQRLTSLQAFTDVLSGDGAFNVSEADGSTRSRLTEMGAAMLVFVDHPIVGVGPGMFNFYYQEYAERIGLRVLNANREAHSLFPGIAAEYGGVGLLAYLAILYLAFRGLARVRRKHAQSRPDIANMATALLLAIITYVTTGVFLHFAYIRFFWLIMGLAGAMVYIAERESAEEPVDAQDGATQNLTTQ